MKTKEQVLSLKPARRLEEADNEHCERMQEREHRPRSCDDSTPTMLLLRADGIFGKDKLNAKPMPHSIIDGDACFAYFNKIWGIPGEWWRSRIVFTDHGEDSVRQEKTSNEPLQSRNAYKRNFNSVT